MTHQTLAAAAVAAGVLLYWYKSAKDAPPPCRTWKPLEVPTGEPDPARGGQTIARRAREVLNAHPLGYVTPPEKWHGVWCLFIVETHPPDAGIAVPHKGVSVVQCAESSR